MTQKQPLFNPSTNKTQNMRKTVCTQKEMPTAVRTEREKRTANTQRKKRTTHTQEKKRTVRMQREMCTVRTRQQINRPDPDTTVLMIFKKTGNNKGFFMFPLEN